MYILIWDDALDKNQRKQLMENHIYDSTSSAQPDSWNIADVQLY